MNASQMPAHLAPLDGAHLNAAQADFILRALQDFRPFADQDNADAAALQAQLQAALDTFDAAHA